MSTIFDLNAAKTGTKLVLCPLYADVVKYASLQSDAEERRLNHSNKTYTLSRISFGTRSNSAFEFVLGLTEAGFCCALVLVQVPYKLFVAKVL